MADRKKLVEILQKKYDHFCDQCGVNKNTHYIENLADHLIAHGVKVLGMQKPLTLEEVGGRLRDVVYAEDKGKAEVIPVFVMRNCISEPLYFLFGRCDGTVFVAYHEDMNLRWRAWAQKPTDEERRVAPWKE